MSKILDTLELVRRELNAFFQNASPRSDDWVRLCNLVDADGAPFVGARDALVLFLYNITHETTIGTFRPNVPSSQQMYDRVTPPLYVNLHLLCFANFQGKSYDGGLAAISTTLSFFQQNPTFDHQSRPDLDPSIEKLTFQMENLGPNDLHQVMSLAGVKYLPSVLFKVRMVPFTSEVPKAEVPAARGYRASGG